MAGSLCPGQKQKIGSLPEPVFRDLLIAADYVLIEADGAKHYSLKYPAEHEPVIPAEATDVILVLGTWDLGKSCQDVIFRFDRMAELTGSGETKEGEAFAVTVKLYTDGSYESTAGDFTETGILMLDSENALCKQYPDHPETAVRGLNQVATVPAGVLSGENGKLTLEGLRVRKSAGLTRYECSVTEK